MRNISPNFESHLNFYKNFHCHLKQQKTTFLKGGRLFESGLLLINSGRDLQSMVTDNL